ncbi:hypothetical protein Efla_003367 [Eimeria flavescens]
MINTLFPSTPTPDLSWLSPIFFVSKKNGELRLVVDYRGLNSQAQPDKFPLPLIDVLIDKMSKRKVLKFVQVYMDDIVVHSTTLTSHHDHRDTFSRGFQKNAFHLNLSNCSFDADSIDFLGYQISPAGVQPLAANVSSILSMDSTFSSRTAVRRFLGKAKYYSRFVPHFSTIAAPVHRLTSDTSPFCWSPPCRSAVANIKYPLANSPVRSIFDGSLPTRFTCDASSFGIGAGLEQQHPDGWYPTQFLSRTFSKPETNYPVIDLTRNGSPSHML